MTVSERKSERLPVLIEPSVAEAIDDFRFSRRIGSRAEAVRRLVLSGLRQEQTKTAEGTAIPSAAK
jgi:metal-responsive CopG/Arc/MetJ family transcriptional regulator